MKFHTYPKRKADTISNGVFLIILGFLFYTGQWWPGILFGLGLTVALRQYLTGRRVDFLITLILIGMLGLLTLAGKMFSLLYPIIFVGLGIYLITKECFPFKSPWKYPSESENFKE